MTPPCGGSTVVPWCGQDASNALTVPGVGWTTRTTRSPTVTILPPPTGTCASGTPPALPGAAVGVPGWNSPADEQAARRPGAARAAARPQRTVRRSGAVGGTDTSGRDRGGAPSLPAPPVTAG